MTIILDENTVE